MSDTILPQDRHEHSRAAFEEWSAIRGVWPRIFGIEYFQAGWDTALDSKAKLESIQNKRIEFTTVQCKECGSSIDALLLNGAVMYKLDCGWCEMQKRFDEVEGREGD